MVNSLLYRSVPAGPVMIADLLNYFLCDGRPNEAHPVLSMLQAFLEPADPINYARGMLWDDKKPPINLLMTEGVTDGYAPWQVFEPLAIAAGLPLLGKEEHFVSALSTAGLPRLALPVSGNLRRPNGDRVTAGFTQYKDCFYSSGKACNGHFVAFNNPRARRAWVEFFRSMLKDGMATIR